MNEDEYEEVRIASSGEDGGNGYGTDSATSPSIDPLHDLVQRALKDVTIAYLPMVTEAMAELMETGPQRYAAIYNGLKEIKSFSAGLFNKLVEKAERKQSPRGLGKQTPEDLLLKIVGRFDGFVADGEAVLFDINIGGRRETLRANSGRLLAHVRSEYYRITQQSAPSDAIRAVVDTIAADVEVHGGRRDVFFRVGADDAGDVYLDLHRPDWAYVRVTPVGWEVCQRPALGPNNTPLQDMPVRFMHSRNALPLPIPEPGWSIEELRRFLVQRPGNEDDKNAFILIVGWLLGTLQPKGPYPGLGLGGPPGSGKTTLLQQLRRLVDPNRAMARSVPQTERDLLISAVRSHVQSFDNLSRISSEMSDAMCRVATGGGLATRMLFTDDEEIVFEACRPLLLASIIEVVTRPDLADRFLTPILPLREGADRRPDVVVEQEFLEAWPRILGALLTAISVGLQRLPTMSPIEDLPRMAGFASWVAACEPGLGWEEGVFLRVYKANIEAAAHTVIEADPVGEAIIRWVESFPDDKPSWTDQATEALKAINAVAGHAAFSAGDGHNQGVHWSIASGPWRRSLADAGLEWRAED